MDRRKSENAGKRMNADEINLNKVIDYRDIPSKGKYQWVTTDGAMFDYFIKAKKHQLSIGGLT